MEKSEHLCGYDVHDVGDREFELRENRRAPCRRVATFVVTDWDICFDLYLYGIHARAVAKRIDDIKPERIDDADLG